MFLINFTAASVMRLAPCDETTCSILLLKQAGMLKAKSIMGVNHHDLAMDTL
jgi:hypothetical protein